MTDDNKGMTFAQLQDSLRENGMIFNIVCTSPRDFFIYETVQNPTCDIHETVRGLVIKHFHDVFQQLHKDMHGEQSDEDLVKMLLSDFEETQGWRRSRGERPMEWLDSSDPRKGLFFKDKWQIPHHFDLFIDSPKLMEFWEGLKTHKLSAEAVKDIMEKFQEHAEYSEKCGWALVEQYPFSRYLIHAGFTEKELDVCKTRYLAKVLSPVLDQYEKHHIYFASNDSVYPNIGRPEFYPIIAGEKLDGSHEVTIFYGYNSI